MKFNEYQVAIQRFEHNPGTDWYYVLGLTGEAGEVAEMVKKAYRTQPKNTPVDPNKLALELGDVLWYLARLAAKYGWTLEEIAMMNVEKLSLRHDGESSPYFSRTPQ